ncbi:hypothetical protein [Bradyrhizobium yuanmingense]|uniref:hypothetical protein n=1 Tax=Bradyrhizobium yuanmingense TaxID=108015 RepID=UPI000AACEE1B|nr:hypothetical protein [Bradyrhizobium yuanmingense]
MSTAVHTSEENTPSLPSSDLDITVAELSAVEAPPCPPRVLNGQTRRPTRRPEARTKVLEIKHITIETVGISGS